MLQSWMSQSFSTFLWLSIHSLILWILPERVLNSARMDYLTTVPIWSLLMWYFSLQKRQRMWLSNQLELRLQLSPAPGLLPYVLSFFDSLSYFRFTSAAFLEEVFAMKMQSFSVTLFQLITREASRLGFLEGARAFRKVKLLQLLATIFSLSFAFSFSRSFSLSFSFLKFFSSFTRFVLIEKPSYSFTVINLGSVSDFRIWEPSSCLKERRLLVDFSLLGEGRGSTTLTESNSPLLGQLEILMSMKDPSFCWRGFSMVRMLLLGSVGRRMEGFLGSCVCLILSWLLGMSSKWLNFDLWGAGSSLNWKPPAKSQLSSLLASESCVQRCSCLEGVVTVLILSYYFYSNMLPVSRNGSNLCSLRSLAGVVQIFQGNGLGIQFCCQKSMHQYRSIKVFTFWALERWD